MFTQKLKLCEDDEPSKLEWGLASAVLLFIFLSYCYWDTASFILYEIKFAGALLHWNLKEAYEPIVYMIDASGTLRTSFPAYDLPIYLIFGIWGIPLYLWCTRTGELVIDFPESFWQMVYGKTIMLLAFILNTVLVYKVCRALDLDRKRSRWGAYLYFTSTMCTLIVGVIGQCDVFAVSVILAGFMYYVRADYKKSMLWFILACQFKQFAWFMFIPLMLLHYKKIYKITGIFSLAVLATAIFNLPIMMLGKEFATRSEFQLRHLKLLLANKIPLFRGGIPVFLFMLGVFCVYCWLHEYKDESDKNETRSQAVFTALTSMVILFTNFSSCSYWFIHMIPYLTIAAVYHFRDTRKFLFLETIGTAALAGSCYVAWAHHFVPNNAMKMLLYMLLGKPDLLPFRYLVQGTLGSGDIRNAVFSGDLFYKMVKGADEMSSALYVIFMYGLVWLSRPSNLRISHEGGGGIYAHA